MLEFLIAYRYPIWLIGGLVSYWLLTNIPTWSRVARAGTWGAERDYASWRVRNAIFALIVLIPLLALTTLLAFRVV